jgi:FkbM family methyltransferase
VKRVGRKFRGAARRFKQWRDPIWQDGWATLEVDGEPISFKQGQGAMYWWADQVRRGRHEPAALGRFSAALAPGAIVLDVGAWIGMYTLLASKRVGADGHVYAFEPNPATRALLDENLRRNRAANVTIVPAAVAGKPGRAWLRQHRTAHSPETTVADDGGGTEVPAVTLASFCANNAISPAVIKIDVEGGESDVLSDEAADVVRAARATIVEVHYSLLRDRGVDPAGFLKRLSTWGLEVRDLGRKSPYTGWIALTPPRGAGARSVRPAIARPDSPATE